jgi:hypothetical protein
LIGVNRTRKIAATIKISKNIAFISAFLRVLGMLLSTGSIFDSLLYSHRKTKGNIQRFAAGL